ncbi:MAG: histidine--tRNA ligase [bacterium]|nr:histidine--tRNA ligase [bacterium]
MSKKTQQFELMLPKGMRDLDPVDKLLQNTVVDAIRDIYERYGYAPLETPLVERMDILRAKFAAGDDSDVSKEIFQVTDQGQRELGLRFDMTVPLARYVAMNPTIKLPFKRYAIGKVFRDGPIKLGRYREFWQADADIIGVPGAMADAEGVMMAADLFRKLNLDVTLYVGSREILRELMDAIGIDETLRGKILIALDKLSKIGRKEVAMEMQKAGLDAEKSERLLTVSDCKGSNAERMSELRKTLQESSGMLRIKEVLELLKDVPNVVFSPSLARGLGYYTGFFFECFLNKSEITSSLVGTGRYDNMIGGYLGGEQEFPGVGISFGVSVICDALRENGEGAKKSLTRVYVVPVSENERSYAIETAQELRQGGINTDMDLLGRGIGKNFAYADALGIPFVVVVGEEERAKQTVTLKDMASGKQETFPREDLLKNLG